jgi:RNA polymerase sigma factor (sigma-70 family)
MSMTAAMTPLHDQPLEALVTRARDGDREALELIVRAIQDRVYGLAMRMLWHPADAEDATQEILIRIITHLGSFRGESAFTTWTYRVAANYLLTTRKRRAEREGLRFDLFAAQLDEGLADAVDVADEVEERLLVEEVKIGCSQAMLLCLDRDHRLAYILGDIFEVSSVEGGDILAITPAAFRKRLSRARAAIQAFMWRKCGLVNPGNPCRCHRRVNHAVTAGRVDPQHLLFADHPTRGVSPLRPDQVVTEMHELQRAAAVYRGHPCYAAPERFVLAIRELLDSGQYRVL